MGNAAPGFSVAACVTAMAKSDRGDGAAVNGVMAAVGAAGAGVVAAAA